ncbi:YeiH family protein [Streptomyces sp. ME03-5684b]|uniref:YeiH family protein n=1 Tax=Streptomyces sp. ME03-5684b TaxID=3028681 RepID=UPI0029A4BA9A|nr:YeiH family protein [Streptomyces sp. ME03-5684b]MDX3319728.1 YeiH family protein [Streptomyces sp. ME03-5684b]
MSDDSDSANPGRSGRAAERTTGAPAAPEPGGPWSRRLVDRLPGLAAAVAVASVAAVVGGWFPLVGGPVAGIVIGVVLAAVRRPAERLKPGITTASKFVLQLSVVLLGCQLSLTQVVRVGGSSLPVMLGSLVACLAAAYFVGRRLGIGRDLRTLIGVGTSICGASAIAAVTPVIGAASAEVAYAVSTIFLFNIAAVLVFPVLGHLLDMSQQAFGLFAGTAVNDTSSVVAAAATYGDEAGQYAVVVKLTRTLLIIPICLWLAALTKRRALAAGAGGPGDGGEGDGGPGAGPRLNVLKLVPWFLVGFLLTALVNTLGLIPDRAHPGLTTLCVFLITVALSAIGLTTDLRGLRRAGPRPLLLGACLWVVVSVTSLALQYLTSFL